MTMFGIQLMRDLTDEERHTLEDLASAIALITLPNAKASPPQMPMPSPGADNLLQGDVAWGDVRITWRDGIPSLAQQVSNPARTAQMPPELWSAIITRAPQDQWAPFAYIFFLESDYRTDAHMQSPREDSWGPAQVNLLAWPNYTKEQVTSYAGAVDAAVYIYNLQGYGAWYNSARMVGLL